MNFVHKDSYVVQKCVNNFFFHYYGWGLHIEGHNTMFCTTFVCVFLEKDTMMVKGHKWIYGHGAVTFIPYWEKTWLFGMAF